MSKYVIVFLTLSFVVVGRAATVSDLEKCRNKSLEYQKDFGSGNMADNPSFNKKMQNDFRCDEIKKELKRKGQNPECAIEHVGGEAEYKMSN